MVFVNVLADLAGDSCTCLSVLGYMLLVIKKFYKPVKFTDNYRNTYGHHYGIDSKRYGLFSYSGVFLSQFNFVRVFVHNRVMRKCCC